MISQKWLCMLQKAYNTFLSFFFFFIYMRNIQVKSFSIHFIDDSSFYLHASDDCMCDINLYSNIFQSLFAHNTRMQPSGIRCVCVCWGVYHNIQVWFIFGICRGNVQQCHVHPEYCSNCSAVIFATGKGKLLFCGEWG